MTTTPLKTASRLLGFATLMVAGFAAWVAATQTLTPHGVDADTSPAVADSGQQLRERQGASRRSWNTQTLAADETESPLTSENDSASKPRGIVHAAPDNRRSSDAATAEPSRRSASRIQPEAGRAPLDEFDPPATDLREPVASSSVESRLATLQQQIDQLAQAQVSQKAQAQSELQADELQQAKELIDQLQKERDSSKIEKLIQDVKDLKGESPSASSGKGRTPDDAPEPSPAEEETLPAGPKKPGVLRAEPMEGKSGRLSIQFQDAEISEALSMLGQLSGMNILVGRGVTGKVPAANLQNVTAEQALDAITKSLGYVFEKEGGFVFVSTPAEALQRKQADRKVATKVFRPRYISAKDLQALVTPLLTKPGELIAVTNPAEPRMSRNELLLLVDYPEVLARVDAILTEIDKPPGQVAIESVNGISDSQTTDFTSSVMAPDGTTLVISEPIGEQVMQSTSRGHGLAALPILGNLFKTKGSGEKRFRRKPPDYFHRVHSTAMSGVPHDAVAVFEQDFSISVPSAEQPPPPMLGPLPSIPLAPNEALAPPPAAVK